MALTITTVKKDVWGTQRVHIADITFDNSYPTGGEPLTKADLGLPNVLNYLGVEVKAAGKVASYDYTNSKLMLFGQTPTSVAAGTIALDELANLSDQSTVVVRVMAIGY